jgi:hypothetical protein
VLCLAALAPGCMFGHGPPDSDAGVGAGRAFADAAPIADGGVLPDGGAADSGGVVGSVLRVPPTAAGTLWPRPLPLARATSSGR